MRTGRRLAVIVALAWVVAGAQAPPEPFFPVAVWYSGGTARAPMLSPVDATSERAWRADLTQIRSLGFNTVRTWVEWSAAEPREGQYTFANLDLLLRLAEDVGLKVIVQVYVDSAPQWVGARFADGHFTTQSGVTLPSQAAPGFCFDHPGVRQAVLRFFEAVARRASRSPALHAYDVWSEPAVMNWALPAYLPGAQYCYCAHTQARFREWLRAKYGDLARLNTSWYRTFTAWDQVEPPRFGTILTYADFADWRVFIGDKIAADLGARAQAVRQVDRTHLVTSHAPNPSPVFRTLADPMDASDDYLMKSVVDYFGTSFYPKLTSPDRDFTLERRVLVMDAAKAVTGDRGFYVGELQAGYGVHGIITGNPVTPADLRLQTWGMVARGARAISYYAYYPMSTGYEAGGYGLVELDGTTTSRARAAGETAQQIARHADALLASRPVPAEVAIVFNPLVPLLGGEQAYGDRRGMHRSVAGYHRMFFERNIAVDLPSARDITAASLRRYKLVVVPYPLVMTATMAQALEAYVKDGGHLFVEARAGWQDERGHAERILPGFGWHQMFGVREHEVLPIAQATVHWGGRRFFGAGFVERFTVLDPAATSVASFDDGTPAAWERRHGNGRAMILGTFAGERQATDPIPNHPLGDVLATWAGLTRLDLAASRFVEVRRLDGPAAEFVLLFNHGRDATQAIYTDRTVPRRRVIDVTANDIVQAGEGAGLTLTVDLPAESVRVFRIEKDPGAH